MIIFITSNMDILFFISLLVYCHHILIILNIGQLSRKLGGWNFFIYGFIVSNMDILCICTFFTCFFFMIMMYNKLRGGDLPSCHLSTGRNTANGGVGRLQLCKQYLQSIAPQPLSEYPPPPHPN